ncbi:unnamed protein product [Leptidea sinapis]|uniref:MD-2-related lipid-recognition domain-containing protein n=1 Tax=Leptidea sinapis TaxID=189913 RepID=A0A5E4PRK3_9NEOP|nr:unnamed protein product [Leptidea sinapis]
MDARIYLLLSCVVFTQAELVRKKLCKDVDSSQCLVHNVDLEPCPDGPAFCLLRRNKPYQIKVDFTPKFTAEKLQMSVSSDSKKDGAFNTTVIPATNACDIVKCPLQDERQTLATAFTISKRSRGKFPIQLMLWNEENKNQTCCLTFNVRTLK